MVIIVARVLLERMPELRPYLEDVVPQHIQHRYQKYMAKRSESVAMEVQLKNPNKLTEMIQILRALDSWKEDMCGEASKAYNVVADDDARIPTPHTILWGDQLTRVRAQSAKQLCNEGATPKERLDSITPAVQDWHAKMHLYEVWYKRHMKEKSAGERGTLKFLQNAVGRYNLPSAPKANMNAVEDFIRTVTRSHILAAAMHFFGMESLTSMPQKNVPKPPDALTKDDQRDFLNSVVGEFVDLYIMPGEHTTSRDSDHVYDYHCSLLHMGVFIAEFEDAIKEGDGGRVIRDWKFMLLFFKAHGNTNYSVEAFNLQAQVQATLPPSIRQQVSHNRFFNSRGGTGNNVPLDLHMEHDNRKFKRVKNAMGANVTEANVKRASRAAPFVGKLEREYEKQTKASRRRGKVKVADTYKDEDILIRELRVTQSFHNTVGRQYHDFKTFERNPFSSLSGNEMDKWLKGQKKKVMRNLTL